MSKSKVFLSVILVSVFLVGDSFSAEETKQIEKVFSIKIADQNFSVVFEDGHYSDELKKTIVKDIQNVYAQFTTVKVLAHSGWPTAFDIPLYKREPIKRVAAIHLEDNKNYSVQPDSFWRMPLGEIIEHDGHQLMIIPNVIVEKYVKAISFRAKYKKVFERLNAFIELFNSLDQRNLTDQELRNLFYDFFEGRPGAKITTDQLRKYVDSVNDYKIAYLSLVEECDNWKVSENDERLKSALPFGDQEVIYCDLPFIERATGKSAYSGRVPMASIDSQWYILLNVPSE